MYAHVGKTFRQRIAESVRLARLGIRLAWRASPKATAAIVLLLALQSAFAPVQLALARDVIDRAALDLGFAHQTNSLAARYPLSAWIVLTAVALAAGQLIPPFSSTLQSLAGDRLAAYVAAQVIRATNRWTGLARFEDPAFADDLERSRQWADRGGLEIVVYGAGALLSLFSVVGYAVLLVGLHPLAPLLIVAASLPAMAGQWEYQNRVGSHLYAQTAEARRLQYSRETLLAPDPAKDVRLYGLGPFFRRRYDELFDRTMAELDPIRRDLALRKPLAYVLGTLASGAVYADVIWLIAHGQRTLGDLALYGGAATLLQSSLGGLGFQIGFLPLPLGFLTGLFHILDAPPDLPVPLHPRPAPRDVSRGVVFEDVSFAYPGGRRAVLESLSFALRPAECVALVGQNGAGKTTLVKLLLRLYDPTDGRILLDGVDLRAYDPADLRRQLGVIFQDFVRYELTVAENVGLGQVEALADRERIRAAVARAGAADLIERLPEGLDTRLGRELGGRELSGGEWQKLALARAFVRECPLLVLDEPTAALDVQTEHDVYLRFRELTRGRMTLLISHRFSTVRMADRIVYLRDGRIQEEGTHAELLERDGDYARLFRLQASQYEARDRGSGAGGRD